MKFWVNVWRNAERPIGYTIGKLYATEAEAEARKHDPETVTLPIELPEVSLPACDQEGQK